MLDTGSIPVSGTKSQAERVQSLPAFSISPMQTRVRLAVASGVVCHPGSCNLTIILIAYSACTARARGLFSINSLG